MRWAWGALALPVLLATAGPSAAADKAETTETARVTVTLADAAGGQVSLVDQPVKFSEPAMLLAKVGEHEHKVQFTLRPGEDKASVKLVVKVLKDGKTIIQEKDLGARVTEPKRVESSDGQQSVTFVVQVPRGKIDVADTTDPLAGS